MRSQRWFWIFVFIVGLLAPGDVGKSEVWKRGISEKEDYTWDYDESLELAPFVPTPMKVVERMLEMARVKSTDVVYDLGSGDGRIVIAAAKKYGARAVGFEIDPELVQKSRDNIRRAGVEHLVKIRQQDIMTTEFSGATVVTIYLLPESNMMLRPILRRQLKPGARVVSNDYDMGDWEPDDVAEVDVKDPKEGDLYYMIYLWRITDRS